MGFYNVESVHEDRRVYRNIENKNGRELITVMDLDEETAQTPGGCLISALAACKLASFIELMGKYRITADEVHVSVDGETGNAGMVDGLRQPISRFLKIAVHWRIKTNHTVSEMEEFLKAVNGACTVGNSLSHDIDISTTLELL